MRQLAIFIIVFVSLGTVLWFPGYHANFTVPYAEWSRTETPTETISLLFLGDAMLGRDVERQVSREGMEFPYLRTKHLIQSADISFVNFEGAVPLNHRPTPDGDLTFSISDEAMKTVNAVGIDVLSLANNHSYDFGEDGYMHTNLRCDAHGLVCGGDPRGISTSTVKYFKVNDTVIAVLFLHDTEYPRLMDRSSTTLKELVTEVQAVSNIQIAYIHWGEEYRETHSHSQEGLAHYLIDSGIDTVIGHHPHVVQDIEIYKEKLIAYSLGNYIFDQYFSEAVQKSTGLMMHIRESDIAYTFIPIESMTTRVQPRLVDYDTARSFLGAYVGASVKDYLRTDRVFILPRL